MWERSKAAQAIANVLVGIDPAVSVFATPPETFNPPAYVCGVVRALDYNAVTFGVDRVEFRLFVSAGPNDYDRLDQLCAQAAAALAVDPMCGGAVISLTVIHQENWRRLSIAGADVLTADLILAIRM